MMNVKKLRSKCNLHSHITTSFSHFSHIILWQWWQWSVESLNDGSGSGGDGSGGGGTCDADRWWKYNNKLCHFKLYLPYVIVILYLMAR